MTDLERYHADRSIGHQPFRSACYAPFVGMTFDPQGMVSVCGFTRATPLGRVGEQTVAEMWGGHVAQEMRTAVRADDLDEFCSRCAEEISGGNVRGVFSRSFDEFGVDGALTWPTRMEFALSTVCNLQCVMCSGEYSSAIRSQREGLPPHRTTYGQEFVEEITPFLAHLEQARFLGGEPFLAEINFAIWQRMIDTGSTAECNVTTNGTQWSPRVEAVLDQLRFSLGISIDGVTRETVEAVRAGASYDRIMENLDRFLGYSQVRGTSVSLTFCLMVENWHEFGDYLRFAEDRGCRVYVNTVRQPPRHSLYHLPIDELAGVVERLESERDHVGSLLEINRAVWFEQIDRLRGHLDTRDGDAHVDARGLRSPSWQTAITDLCARLSEPDLAEDELLRRLRDASHDGQAFVVRCDADDNIAEGDRYLGIDIRGLLGSPVAVVFPVVAELLGRRVEVLAELVRRGCVTRVVSYEGPGADPTVIVSTTRRGPRPHATTKLAAVLRRGGPPDRDVPVRLMPTRR